MQRNLPRHHAALITTPKLIMADEESVARNRGRRTKKEPAKEPKDQKESKEPKDTLRTVDSGQSQSPAVRLKRKHVYDSLEHCRAVRSKSAGKNTKAAANEEPETSSTLEGQNGSDDNTLDFIESLKSKSSSKSGRYHDTSVDGKACNLKITTWNINGLRSWLGKRSGLAFIAQDDADIYCFQETKCSDSKVPNEIKNIPGYSCYWNGTETGHSGVVCFAKKKPVEITYGIGKEIYDKEARVITMEFDKFYVINVYVPNSGRELVRLDFRMKWDADFLIYLKDLDSKKPIIVCGDLNVSHHEIDLANPKTNLKTAGFTIGERNNFSKLLNEVTLVDVFRFLNPEKRDCYTYWTYMRNAREKNVGWRLDYFLISQRWFKKVCDCIIRNDVFGSDHCPVSLYLSI